MERLFSANKGAAGIFRADLSHHHINDELQLLNDKDPGNDKALISKARAIWISLYGRARNCAGRPDRLHAGKPRQSSASDMEKPSLCKWLKRRRAEVTSLTASKKQKITVDSKPAPEVVGVGGWTANHAKEKAFQNDKRTERFMQAIDEGGIVTAERSPRSQAALKMWKDYGSKRVLAYHAEKTRAEKRDRSPTLNVKSFSNVFVDGTVDFQGGESKFTQALRKYSIKRTHTRLSADVFVVPNVTQLGQRIQWCAMLAGRVVCDVKCLISGGTSGSSLAFKSAVSSRKLVWCSDNFREAHVELYNILCHCAALPQSNWRWLVSKEGVCFLALYRPPPPHPMIRHHHHHHRRPNHHQYGDSVRKQQEQMLDKATKRSAEVVAFVSSAEQVHKDTSTKNITSK